MKIWEAKLILFYAEDGSFKLRFTFESDDKDYKENEKFNEWFCSEGWIGYKIQMNMVIEKAYGNLKVIQGFDHELNKEELKQLELEIRRFMRKKLDYDREIYQRDYEKKLSVIKG